MRRFLLLTLIAWLLAGCDQQALIEKFVPQEESALAKELIARLAAKDFAPVEARLDASLQTPDARDKLRQIAAALPADAPKAIQTVGTHTRRTSAATTYTLTYEYEYPNTWLIANAVLERRDGQVYLQGIHVWSRSQSLAQTNRFTFEGKGWAHYLVFALAIGIPLFVLYALVACARTRFPRRKWLWLLFVAVGFVQFQFNWTDGDWGIQPLSFLLLGAGFTQASPIAPLIFTLAFPLGAVVFLARRRALQKPTAP